MFRTRDFLLLFTLVVFLLLAIITTWLLQSVDRADSAQQDGVTSVLADVNQEEYRAEVSDRAEISRAENLAAIKEKIAAGEALSYATPVIIEDEETEEDILESVASNDTPVCPNPQNYVQSWPTVVMTDMTEGARRFYIEAEQQIEVKPATASSAAEYELQLVPDVLLEMPAVPLLITNTCPQYDVIGVSTQGALIRNVEVSAYRIFGAETVVGYALDGVPIRGLTTVPLDECGGALVNGVYSYYIGSEDDTILHCFKGLPAKL